MEKRDRVPCRGPIAEIRAHGVRGEGRPPTDPRILNDAFEKVDPGGVNSHLMAVKYMTLPLFREFMRLCKAGGLGDYMESAEAAIPKFVPPNSYEKACSLIFGAMIFACLTPEYREKLIARGGWKKGDLELD